eukprot:1156330-Pelagomonas_calceolata.AAC.7
MHSKHLFKGTHSSNTKSSAIQSGGTQKGHSPLFLLQPSSTCSLFITAALLTVAAAAAAVSIAASLLTAAATAAVASLTAGMSLACAGLPC